VIAAEAGGKVKTTLQIIAILCLILRNSIFGIDLYDIGFLLIWVSLILSLISGIQYTISFGRKI